MDFLDYSPSFGTFRLILHSAVREKIASHTYTSDFNSVDQSFSNCAPQDNSQCSAKSAEEDRGVTAAVQAGFSDESLTADATELLDLELSNKLHSSTSSDTSSTI
ncbi:hypothetical protein AVEN_269317-1 [Araneus ventricosus]|uniref:Uncharacterized protein n=1 Tax=Araneus ventricosus TaxID=182803 RepID=A0A4Y2I442_ARAVE|nr:hypothetical protein AVEN_269317-1 [Araneus ventricosus]